MTEDWEALGLRRAPPLSARRLPAALPQILLDHVAVAEQTLAEPFVGITTDGTVRPGLFPLASTGVSTRPIVDAGAAFLAALAPAQREGVTFPIDSANWQRWSNVHIYLMRHGLLLEDLDDRQRAAALDLLR